MVKKVIASLFASLLIITSASSCAADTQYQDLIAEVFNSLGQMATAGVAEIDGELEGIYQELYNTDVKLLKVEQVITPAQEWVEYQKGLNHDPGDWLIGVQKADLEQFKNDQYQISTLEVTILKSGTESEQFSSEIKVRDLETGSTANAASVRSDLADKQKALERNTEKKLEQRKILISAMEGIIAGGGIDWEIEKVDKSTYVIKSGELGWADKLTMGVWTYNIDTKKFETADRNSAALKKLLSGLM